MNYDLETLWRLATSVAKSGYYGRLTTDQAFVLMLYGVELGFDPITSLSMVWPVDGKPALSGRGVLALLHRSPKIKSVEIDRLTDADGRFFGYRVTITRSNGSVYSAEWTLEDARRAGLLKRPTWMAYPEAMSFWRALGRVGDMAGADILAGSTFGINLAGEPETAALTAELVREAPLPPPPQPAKLPSVTLDDLAWDDDEVAGDDPASGPEPETDEETEQ